MTMRSMPEDGKVLSRGPRALWLRNLWLRALVQLDAVRLAPRAWLTAAWWRLLGKRVRARRQFAPLKAASPRAYRLWLMDEPSLPRRQDGAQEEELGPPVVVIVAAGAGQRETLRSLEGQGGTVLALGTPDLDGIADVAERIDWAGRPWLMALSAGDRLAPGAVAAYRAAAAGTDASVIYADDDLIDSAGRRADPHFKPSWNAELHRHFDYLAGSCMVRIARVEMDTLADGDWMARMVDLAVAEGGTGQGEAGRGGASLRHPPQRLAHILHHRATRLAPLRALPEVAGTGPRTGQGALPKVTVIVPTRNRIDLLRTCIEGLARTDYPALEVIVVDNGSDDPATLDYLARLDPVRHRVLRDPGPFNYSRLNNRAAREATGDLLCLLNNDIEMLSSDWLAIMVRQALRPEVGAVGAQLLYPDGRIQHAGVVMGICGGAGHAHRLLHPDAQGYFRRHALPQFVSAVTAACLVVRRESFEAVGGLDEENFAVAFNDVDLCMRLNMRGWQSLYEPRARLVHHESVSRGRDRDPTGAARLASELAALQARWRTAEEMDPWHHPQLDRFSEHFVLALRR